MEHLLEFCDTDDQRTKVKLYSELNSCRKVAEEMGICHQNVSKTLRMLKKRAAQVTIPQDTGIPDRVPEGFNIKGTTTLYKDGEARLQWVKTQNNGINFEDLVDTLKETFEDYRSPKLRVPEASDDDLLVVYPMGDPHLGMLSWHEETGEDHDLEIASKDLRKATKYLVERSPSAKTAIILNLGDFYHSDNMDNRTARSGNALDVDGRFDKIMRVGLDLMVEIIVSALEKHENVVVRNMMGNHDDHTSKLLAISLGAFFRDEPRVTIDTSANYFWYYQFGKNLIGSCHGNTAKPDKLPHIMAADKPKEWGDTEYRYWYTGHIHSKNSMEFPGCTWESFRTLAAKDAWHASMGYRSGRDMNSITLHREYGEVGRNTASIKMIRSKEN